MYAAEGLLVLAKQLEKLFDQYVVIDGQRVVNPLRDHLVHQLREKGISRMQRRYLSQMASVTARDDALTGPYETFWHIFRDYMTKRLPTVYYGNDNMESTFEVLLFSRITIANFRTIVGRPYQALDPEFAQGPVNAGSFRDFGHFLDYLQEHLLPRMEMAMAQVIDADIGDLEMTIEKRIQSIRDRLQQNNPIDLMGIEIIGPIDAVRYGALKERRREPSLVHVA